MDESRRYPRGQNNGTDRDRHDRHRSIYLGHRLEDGRISIGCSRFSIAAHQRSGHPGSKGGVILHMKFNVHAGHNPDGKIACGAVGLIRESTEARKVKKEVIKLLRQKGHTVYDCTCQNGTSQTDVLKRIVTKCNQHKVDLDISIHFNSGVADKKGNGKTTGTEVWVYSQTSSAKPTAERVVKEIAALGFHNRGVKDRKDLYVLRRTNSPAMLVECCFVDDKDDVMLYDAKKMAAAIVDGILVNSEKK